MDVPELRRQVRAAIEAAKRDAGQRRERADAASRDFTELLTARAVPLLHQLAAALSAEGHRFKVFTPADSVRLASERSADDFIELSLDTAEDPPVVVAQTSLTRGRRTLSSERPVRRGVAIAALTEADILDFMLGELQPFLER